MQGRGGRAPLQAQEHRGLPRGGGHWEAVNLGGQPEPRSQGSKGLKPGLKQEPGDADMWEGQRVALLAGWF